MACCGPESWIRSAMYLQNVLDLHYTFTWYTCRVFILYLNNRWIRNHNRWPGGHAGPHVCPGKARWEEQGGKAPQKLLAFQHLNELLVHVFLPIFASIFTCITALLCVKETQQKIIKKNQVHVHQDVLNK